MSREAEIKAILATLPDCVVIFKGRRVAMVTDGEVVELHPDEPAITPQLGTGDNNPK